MRDTQAGITLIEVLVVLAVIGVATGATMLGLNAADRDTRAETEAVRLARHLSLGVDEALIGGRTLALVWDARGYRFQRRGAAGWEDPASASLAQRHDLRSPLVLTRDGTGVDPVLIAASASGPLVTFAVGGRGVAWQVEFDGFTAIAEPEGGA
jgi:general secretion pathway protein H